MRIPKLIPVESSGITGIAYIYGESALFVRFISDKVYMYLDVPGDIYEGLRTAESKGRFFNQYIRDVYRYLELEDQ